MASIQLKLRPFNIPNFAIVEGQPVSRQEGINFNSNFFPISELSNADLAEMCEDWRRRIYEKAGKELPELIVNNRIV